MSIFNLAGDFMDMFDDSKQKELDVQSQQARLAFAERSRQMIKNASINAVSIWSQGVSGTIANQAQDTIDTTNSQLAQEKQNLEEQIQLKQDAIDSDKVKQVFGFITDIASTAAGIYSGFTDITAATDLKKPKSSNYNNTTEGSALFAQDYKKWETNRNLLYIRNALSN